MRFVARLSSLALCAGLSACGPQSLQPLHAADKSDVVFDEEYLGAWVSADRDASFLVAPNDGGGYLVTLPTADDEVPLAVEAHVVAIRAQDGSEHRFVDCWPATDERKRLSSRYGPMALPTHTVLAIRWGERDGKRVLLLGSMRVFWGQEERDGLEALRQTLPDVTRADRGNGDDGLLAGGPAELRAFYAATTSDDRFWEFQEFTRHQPPPDPGEDGR